MRESDKSPEIPMGSRSVWSKNRGRIRAFVLAVATFVLGLGLPYMGIGRMAIPWLVAVGALGITFILLTDTIFTDILGMMKCPRWGRIPLIAILCLGITIGVYFGVVNSIEGVANSQPKLTIDNQRVEIVLSDNEISNTKDATLVFHIDNIGTGTAYHIRQQMIVVDDNNSMLGKIKIARVDVEYVNHIDPNQIQAWSVILPQPYKEENGIKALIARTWLIHCRFTCWDKDEGGKLYDFPDFWYRWDINDPNGLAMLSKDEVTHFEPVV